MARGKKRQPRKSEVARQKLKCKRCNMVIKQSSFAAKQLDDWTRFGLCPKCTAVYDKRWAEE